MPGEARTADFLLSTATMMIGPQSKVMELTPELHSLGLIKNVQVSSDPTWTQLTQGISNQVVASINTNNQAKISGEVYEFSARNLAYGAGLDASATAFDPITTSYALSMDTTASGTSVHLATGGGADFSAGDYLVIQDTDEQDRVHVGLVASITSDVLTLATGYALPLATYAVANTIVYRVRAIKVGALPKPTQLGAKLVGTVPNSSEPVTLVFPKIEITKGFSLSFQDQNWSNMPFEFTPMSLLRSDPYYADMKGGKQFMVLKR